MYIVERNKSIEIAIRTQNQYSNPYLDVEVDFIFASEHHTIKIPAFWAGENKWKVRFSSHLIGEFQFKSICSNQDDKDLSSCEGRINVVGYEGENYLYSNGAIRVSDDKSHFEHANGKAFMWLGDTWWFCLQKRLKYPEDYSLLLKDRAEKGFNVIQFVAGLYPDMKPFDKRGISEAGFPLDETYKMINPTYFEVADRKITAMVEHGLVPCIFAFWGYYVNFMDKESMKAYWRYLIARYASLPVFWCIAGEAIMPFYTIEDDLEGNSKKDLELNQTQEKCDNYINWSKGIWSEISAFIKETDGYKRPISIHPANGCTGSECVLDAKDIDFDMLQSGHSGWQFYAQSLKINTRALQKEPKMPVVLSEISYEGICGMCGQEVQRYLFTSAILMGCAGYTYGANVMWVFNIEGDIHGDSPYGRSWGYNLWKDAYDLPGGRQIGNVKNLLSYYEFNKFEAHNECVEGGYDGEKGIANFCAGIKGNVLIFFFNEGENSPTIYGLDQNTEYIAYYYDPILNIKFPKFEVKQNLQGSLIPKSSPLIQDIIFVLEAV